VDVERKRFTAEFKREAVRLMEGGDKPVAQLALELGVPRNRLYKWRDAIATEGGLAFRGSGRRSPQQQELAQLRRQVARLELENTILKKATAYFASAPKRGTPGSTDNG
jgi:transposase